MSNKQTPNASYSLTLRVKIHNRPGKLGEIATAIGKAGGDIEAVDIVSVGKDFLIRDITVNAASEQHDQEIIAAVSQIDGVEIVHVSDRTFLMHLGGKIETVSKMLGHTSIKTTQHYAKLLDTRIGSDMEALQKRLAEI